MVEIDKMLIFYTRYHFTRPVYYADFEKKTRHQQ